MRVLTTLFTGHELPDFDAALSTAALAEPPELEPTNILPARLIFPLLMQYLDDTCALHLPEMHDMAHEGV